MQWTALAQDKADWKVRLGWVMGNISSSPCSDSDKENILIWVKIWSAEYKKLSNVYRSW